jgi:hypothetical protein
MLQSWSRTPREQQQTTSSHLPTRQLPACNHSPSPLASIIIYRSISGNGQPTGEQALRGQSHMTLISKENGGRGKD